eukprot:243439-Amorphochlora_amoeboformis.AAC.1
MGLRGLNLSPVLSGYSFRMREPLGGSAMANVRANSMMLGGKWYFEVLVGFPGTKAFRVGIAGKGFHPQ